jgi:hypothetical protein
MTAVRPGLPSPSPSAGDAPLVPSSCRVSILVGDSRQIDLVLPAAVPLSALTDATRDAANRVLRTRGNIAVVERRRAAEFVPTIIVNDRPVALPSAGLSSTVVTLGSADGGPAPRHPLRADLPVHGADHLGRL